MSASRWILAGGNALARGALSCATADTFYPTENLVDGVPLRPLKMTSLGANEVLLDSDLAADGSPFTALPGEPLHLLSGVGIEIQNLVTRDFLQVGGATWGTTPAVNTGPLDFTVQDYDRCQQPEVSLAFTLTPVIIPVLDALTLHGHGGLWRSLDAIQWHAGAAAAPVGLVVEDQPRAFTQILEPVAPVKLQFHRLVFTGNAPYVGDAVLGKTRQISQCFTAGRTITERWPQTRLSVPAGYLGSYAWVSKANRLWQGQMRTPQTSLDSLRNQVFRGSQGGSLPMVWLPEDGVVMMGFASQQFDPKATNGPGIEDISISFEECPLPLVGD
jgi:hypothetical protein